MNRIILAGASILALTSASAALGQATVPAPCIGVSGNCSVVDSSGTGNSANVDQTGGTGNVSDVFQDGDTLGAMVIQGADDNISNIDQTTDNGSSGLTALVTQSGGADSVVSQSAIGVNSGGMAAIVDQSGASASDISQSATNETADDYNATVIQTGDGHSSIISQSDLGGGTNDGGFFAAVSQSGSGNESDIVQINRDQFATVTQTGTDGVSSVFQEGRSNSATLDQSGTGNTSFISQDDAGGVGQTATVTQSGSSNFADVFQDGRNPGVTNDGNNTATIDQAGTEGQAIITQVNQSRSDEASITQLVGTFTNTALVEQTGDDTPGSPNTDNSGTIIQFGGTDNFSTILQGDTTPFGGVVGGADNSSATSLQNGNELVSSITQGGTSQSVIVDQLGEGNEAVAIQGDFGGSGSSGSISQSGSSGSLALLFQNSNGSLGTIIQNGDSNISGIDQGFAGGTGAGADGNIASANQDGDGNESQILQNVLGIGGANTATLLQENDGNFSLIDQEGTTNSATVNQYDGSTSNVTQAGSGNTATVTQGTP